MPLNLSALTALGTTDIKVQSVSNSRDLTTGPIWLNLLRLAGPMVFGIVAVISVSLVDTYYVGQLGTQELTALSFSFPVTLSVSSLAIGLGAGASSVVSRAIGNDNRKDGKRLATDSIVLAVLLVIAVAAIGYLSIDPLFRMLGAEGEVLDMIGRYMRIWFLAVPLLVVPIVANSIVRAVGDAFWPSAVMVSSALINIAVTPIFIFGWGPIPAMNLEGAAIGTMVAWAFTLVGAFLLVGKKEQMLTLSAPPIADIWTSWKKVLAVGVPASFGNAVNPIGIAIVTSFLATFGDNVVAGFGVATRVESLSVIPMLALSSAIGPFSGQNWGADKHDRILGALRISYGICVAWAAVLAVFFWFAAAPIVSVFTADQNVIDEAVRYLTIVPLSVWGYGMVIIAAGGFNAIGRSKTGLAFYLTRTAVFYVPLSLIASAMSQSWYVFAAIAVANAISGILVAGYSYHTLRAEQEEEGETASAPT